jgi:HD-GYP domain-containing protein (c-di-GMP phosphodiesterase class II)
MMSDTYIGVPKRRWKYIQYTRLFTRNARGCFTLYSDGRVPLAARIATGRLPAALYVHSEDKQALLDEIGQSMIERMKQLSRTVRGLQEAARFKAILIEAVDEMIFDNPKGESLAKAKEFIHDVIGGIDRQAVKLMLQITGKDFTTASHSVNMLTLGVNLGLFLGWTPVKREIFSLCCLLHDIGKSGVSNTILKAPRRLTQVEFEEIKQHTRIGCALLERHDFGGPAINGAVRDVALNHHERLDGTGYLKKTALSEFSGFAAIIDCFEALTSDDRSYRRALSARDALAVIGDDCRARKLNTGMWRSFVRSLRL